MNETLKNWYRKNYPEDSIVDDMVDGYTFYDLFETLDRRKNVYDLFVHDSVVRERLFERLACLIQADYDYVFDQWLLGE